MKKHKANMITINKITLTAISLIVILSFFIMVYFFYSGSLRAGITLAIVFLVTLAGLRHLWGVCTISITEPKQEEQDQQVFVYFDLIQVSDGKGPFSDLGAEHRAYYKIWEMLKSYSASNALSNEGHDSSGALPCHFVVKVNKILFLEVHISNLKDGGDSIDLGDGFVAQDFEIVEQPGLSKPIPFESWKTYAVQKGQEFCG
jgi:hypothetical protein